MACGYGDPIVRTEQNIEINLIVNAQQHEPPSNLLMDIPEKHAGYAHVALRVASLRDTMEELSRLSIPLSSGPTRLGDGTSLFIRDPDRNVIELREKAARGESGSA